ncbi:cysteine hydrolase family protein [Bacillus toyonensis]|uniref:Cysteine hydrolase n=1 Tax=Bacillus toyonensis TaxID=155322 RepID=A0A2B5X3P5_9BACI|nr:cysteine hydrolase family protein [Bacillus toyonensis]PGA91003.1 cysteine hydrolase [Bacillus toyonensis]PHD57423.1 cysteine hydrolase [Bacillus toyonensis]
MMKGYTALLIIDVQVGSFNEKRTLYKGTELLRSIQLLRFKACSVQAPIFYMKFNGKPGSLLERGTPGWEIHESIAPLSQDIVLEKNHPDSFHETNLQQELNKRKIKHIVITGIQSEICIDATCRRAYSLGYDVTLVEDGHSTYDTTLLAASKIIKHHNDIIGEWFANVKKAHIIQF